jgi:hypothetical protein
VRVGDGRNWLRIMSNVDFGISNIDLLCSLVGELDKNRKKAHFSVNLVRNRYSKMPLSSYQKFNN